jgi:DNA-directed RNA polymerase specialized sigma subunit
MTYSGNMYSEKRLFESAEMLDENMTMYYLNNLPECKVNIARGLKILYELEETEDQIYQAISLRCRISITANDRCSSSADQNFLRVQEECEKEKRAIHKERALLQNFLKIENRKITILEGCIFSLSEPQRSIVIARYIDRQSWAAIQKGLKRSASRVFVLNKEGIEGLHNAIKVVNRLSEPVVEVM